MDRRGFLKAIPAAPAAMAAAAAPPKAGGGKSPRLRTAICAYSFRDALGKGALRYEDLVDMAIEHDVDGLDLTVYWFPKTGLEKFLTGLRLKAYLNAVEIPSIAIRTDLCRKSERDQDQEAAWLMHWVDAANMLGASFIRVFGGNVPKDSTEDEAASWVVEILKRTADYAGSKGVILGLENHGGITLEAARIHKIIDAVNHPFVRMNLDTGNFRTRPYEQIEASVSYAANTQFKVEISNDGKREESDWDRIVKMLADGGYRGYMALEYEADEDPFTAVPRHLKTLNDLKKKYGA